jgi:putative membrane protein
LFEFAIRVLINGIALIAAVRLVPNVTFSGDLPQLVVLAVVFGLVNAFVRPIVKLLSLPLTVMTFGLIGFVINAGMVMLSAAIGDNLNLGFQLAGWPPGPLSLDVLIAAFLVAIVLSVVSALAAFVRLATPGRGRP